MAGRRDWTREDLAAGVRDGDRRALARTISLVEDGDPLAYGVVADLYPQTGSAYSVGVTGPPGVGKSSLVSALIRHVREREFTVGVVSVDPSSPFTHGALLGDRIRLTDHFLDPEVFIRSMGTRGHLGGLAEAALQALLVLDASGKDVVFLETVGAGQSEVEVIGIADTVLLVLMPGLRRLRAGAEGGDHGDPGRDRDQQDGQPGREDDAERGALDPGARPQQRLEPADRPHRSRARRARPGAVGEDRGASRVPRPRAGSSRSGAARISPARCSRLRRAGQAVISSTRSPTTPSCGGCLRRCRRGSSTR